MFFFFLFHFKDLGRRGSDSFSQRVHCLTIIEDLIIEDESHNTGYFLELRVILYYGQAVFTPEKFFNKLRIM